jgi:alkanesulfonate monooxygenase SsuD/methylene tetrahydromethanopterin reductase-like flavin-dependent oxidoreductase (luciferase family)
MPSSTTKTSGQFYDESKRHVLDHKGTYFAVCGPLNVAPAPQRHPVIVQAGASNEGRELAAATADVVYCLHDTVEAARAYYVDMKGRIGGHGLLGHGDGVARVGRHDRRPQFNARGRPARQCHHQERVVVPRGQVGQPEARKPGGFRLLRLRDQVVQRVRFAGATGQNAESHSDPFLERSCRRRGALCAVVRHTAPCARHAILCDCPVVFCSAMARMLHRHPWNRP